MVALNIQTLTFPIGSNRNVVFGLIIPVWLGILCIKIWANLKYVNILACIVLFVSCLFYTIASHSPCSMTNTYLLRNQLFLLCTLLRGLKQLLSLSYHEHWVFMVPTTLFTRVTAILFRCFLLARSTLSHCLYRACYFISGRSQSTGCSCLWSTRSRSTHGIYTDNTITLVCTAWYSLY